MPVTIIRDRPPRCMTCKRPLTSWHFGADDHSERCEACDNRAVDVGIRRIFRDVSRAMNARPSGGEPRGGG